jgi:glycosyltransferase involved in cell wall biosynthesis
MLSGQSVVCVSSIDWDFLWQQHQEIMSALARAGNDVLFIENTGVRAPRWGDFPRLVRRLKNRWRARGGMRRELDRLYVHSPIVVPLPYSRVAQRINRSILVAAVRSWIRLVDARDPILWTFLPTRASLDLVRAIRPRLVVYYCTDNFAATSPGAGRVVETERELLRRADLVFAMSRAMVEHCRRYSPDAIQIPMGVNVGEFERVRDAAFEMPEGLAGVRRPIVGYVGGVRRWIDKELVKRIARARPDCTIVFVGPIQMPVGDLGTYGNIRLLGVKPHDEIPRYIKAFDCCILPYEKTPYTDSVSPAKLHEYLIMGKPVVSTDIAEVAALAADHADGPPIVYLATSHDEFLGQLARALDEPGSYAPARILVAREQAWDRKIETMLRLLQDRLEATRTDGEAAASRREDPCRPGSADRRRLT